METFPRSRAQSPAHSPAEGGLGELRLHAILRALLLALLSVLLGRRRQPQAWLYDSACHIDAEWLEEFALPFPQAESPRPIRIRSIHDGTHMVIEHPIMYVFGPPPRRGMRNLPRTAPILRPRIARGPPFYPDSLNHIANPRQKTLVRGRRPTPIACRGANR